jgi:hypothetical protein
MMAASIEAIGPVIGGGIGCVYCVFIAFALLAGTAGTVLWIWMLVDCLTKESDQGNTKIVWTLVILLTHVIGALIYILVRRPQRKQELGR